MIVATIVNGVIDSIDVALNGIGRGLNKMGAKVHTLDEQHLWIEIPKGGQLDDMQKLKRIKDFINQCYGIGLKVKRV